MIGVLCSEEEREAVCEFFELFKTPWEFFHHNRTYSVVLATMNLELAAINTNCLICYNWNCLDEQIDPKTISPSKCEEQFFLYNSIKVPVYRDFIPFNAEGIPFFPTGKNCLTIGDKIIDNGRTQYRLGFNLFKEVEFLLSEGQPTVNAFIPTLDIHISSLRNMILSAGIPVVEIPPSPKDYDSFVCLTHDVDFAKITDHKWDHTLCGFLYDSTIGSVWSFLKGKSTMKKCLNNLGAVFSLPFVYLGLKKDFFQQFENYLDIEKGIRATYFVIPFKNRHGDMVDMPKPRYRVSRYDIQDIRHWTNLLLEKGHEVGVHGIDAWHDVTKGRSELNKIAEAIENENIGIRIHWLCFNSNSPKLLDEAGFSYDSTFGYNSTVGFRAGTAQVFRPLGTKRLLEVPLHIQDIALFNTSFLNMNGEQADQICNEIVNQILTYGGVLTVLWHLRSLAPGRLWGDHYIRLLNRLKKHPVLFATAGQIAEWFRLRRKISYKYESFSGNQIDLQLESSEDVPYSQFALRVYRPFSNKTAISAEHVDYIENPCLREKSIAI